MIQKSEQLLDRLLPPPPVPASQKSLTALGASAAAVLERNILPYWMAHSHNPSTGGFWGEVRPLLGGRARRKRGAILASRILWTFAAAFRRFRSDPSWLEMATYARDELLRTFRDRTHGGFFWSVDADGAVVDGRKQTYGQSFVLYALAEYHRATGDPTAIEEAISLFHLIEAHARDRHHGGYVDCRNVDWSPEATTEDGVVKSINTMLHLIEAYDCLYRAWPDPALASSLSTIVRDVLEHMVYLDGSRVHQELRADWTPVSGNVSYGHDLETGWLAVAAAESVGDRSLIERARRLVVATAEKAANEGMEPDGGIIFDVDADGVRNRNKYWWVQAEATVAFLCAFEVGGDQKLLSAAQRVWNFIEHRLVDWPGGDWFASTTPGGRPRRREAKVSFWKCPYHSGRACLELHERATRLALRDSQRWWGLDGQNQTRRPC